MFRSSFSHHCHPHILGTTVIIVIIIIYATIIIVLYHNHYYLYLAVALTSASTTTHKAFVSRGVVRFYGRQRTCLSTTRDFGHNLFGSLIDDDCYKLASITF